MLELIDMNLGLIEFALCALVILIAWWVERPTPEELAAAEERRKMQAGIDRNAIPHMPKYNIFVGTQERDGKKF